MSSVDENGVGMELRSVTYTDPGNGNWEVVFTKLVEPIVEPNSDPEEEPVTITYTGSVRLNNEAVMQFRIPVNPSVKIATLLYRHALEKYVLAPTNET